MRSLAPDNSSLKPETGVTTESQSLPPLFAQLCEEFSGRIMKGEDVAIDEYVVRYPSLASEIRTAFPALRMINAAQVSADPSDKVDIPDTIAGCEIIRPIGSGGMGVVYEARHPNVSRRIAIKVLKRQHQKIAGLCERFLREAEATARLSHPHIVPFIDFGHDETVIWLSMPLIDGRSLDGFLHVAWKDVSGVKTTGVANSTFVATDFKKIARIGADAASALAHAHQRNTIHRDIKPANLILDADGKIWVTDFGLAKILDSDSDLSKTGDMIGTPRYMAPEQFRGVADERSDIYSLGVTLYELVTGTRAWDNNSHCAVIDRHSTDFELPAVLKVNPHVPRKLARIISRACAHSPKKRYRRASDLQFELNQFAHDDDRADRRRVRRASTVVRAFCQPLLLGVVGIVTALLTLHLATRQEAPTPDTSIAVTPIKLSDASNQRPVASGSLSRSVTVPSGVASISNLQLSGCDPDGHPFRWRLAESPDRHHFVAHAISGRLCFRTPPDAAVPFDADGNNEFELRLVADDAQQPHVAIFTQRQNDGQSFIVEPALRTRAAIRFPANLMALASADGAVFVHSHRSKDGTVALYESTRQSNPTTDASAMQTRLMQSDCRLSPFTRGLIHDDKDRWLSLVECRGGFQFQWLRLNADHAFSLLDEPFAADLLQNPVGLSRISDADLQVLDLRVDGPVLLEMVVGDTYVSSYRELPCGWDFGNERPLAMAAWLNAREPSQAVNTTINDHRTVNVRIRVTSPSSPETEE